MHLRLPMSRDIIARETRALSLASLGAPVNTLGKFALFCFQIKFAMLSVVLLLPHTEPRDASDSAWVSEGTPSYSVSENTILLSKFHKFSPALAVASEDGGRHYTSNALLFLFVL